MAGTCHELHHQIKLCGDWPMTIDQLADDVRFVRDCERRKLAHENDILRMLIAIHKPTRKVDIVRDALNGHPMTHVEISEVIRRLNPSIKLHRNQITTALHHLIGLNEVCQTGDTKPYRYSKTPLQ